VGFLAPFYLLLGAGAAVPLVVHLLRRRSGLRVEFPAVRYLARAEQEHSRQLRIRNLLLMLLRVLAVVLIAVAAARPLSEALGAVVGVGHAPTALAVVLDNSLSTSAIEGGRPVLDRLKEVARSAVARAAVGDRVWLVTADGRTQGGSQAVVAAAIARTEALAGAGNLQHAVTTAAYLVRGSGIADGAVAIVTDGQATAWTNGDVVDAGGARAVLFTLSTPPPANHAVTEVVVRPARWTPRGEITATVIGASDSTPYRISLDGRTLARGSVTHGGVSVHAAPPERGWVAGTVELDPDELRGDDVRHFALWIGEPPGVLVDSSVGAFLRGALDALVAGGEATLGGTGNRVAVLSADNLRALPALIVAPRDPVRVGAANRALERAGVPWRLGGAHLGETAIDGTVGGVALSGISASSLYSLELQGVATADTIARAGATSAPWAVAGPGYVLIASPLEPSATTFPLRASFVPWVGELLTQHMRSGEPAVPGRGGTTAGRSGALQAAPGETIHRPEWAGEIEEPDGTRRAIGGSMMEAPARPGVYFLHRLGGERAGALVVNGEARESELRRLPPAELASRVRGRRVSVYVDAQRWASAAFDASAERPLAAPLLAAVLGLLVLEALVVRSWSPSSGWRRAQRPPRIDARRAA